MYALDMQGLSKSFKGKKRQTVEALKGLTLSIEQGEVFGFLGPNGAGKSTTIKCLMGLIRPTSGTASIMGEAIGSEASRRNVGYLPENPAFYDYLTAEEYLQFVGKTFKMPDALLTRRSAEVLKQLELWEARKRPIRGYSKGMVQRVGLAQVLIHDPDVYILDEPMSGLDPIGRALVKEIIVDLKKRGKSVFFSTHITDDVEKVCDRVGILLHGELKLVDRVDAIMSRGIVGYQVRLKDADGAVLDEEVPKELLDRFLAEQVATGREIVLVEPRRKNLEDFFLSLVHGV
ncbi:ABC transporter ATP-binding protein [Trichlorobacter lovleyi]|uniref:ABC transporter related n=1 Tax=Trichlorobacter lovleyi (strain ATCC BAA-1151 / DSM 17278 / SZ) TaxID=398767 RepID=B3E3I6_TRIL1|nr:ABC transporter ATP-binding protein [Trichlorobacter lovleyi]ACD95805.1 ABC transporter related [Trichlorobacter lovleyi SZ]